MRLDLLITELEVGGAERCLVSLALYLHRKGHRVRVISIASPPEGEQSQLVKCLKEGGVETAFLHADHPRQLLGAIKQLRKLLDDSPPELLQTFLFHANLLGALAIARRPIRLVGGIRVADPSRWRAVLQRWAARSMDRVVCVSQDVLDHAAHRERISARKLIVIANGVEMPSSWNSAKATEQVQCPLTWPLHWSEHFPQEKTPPMLLVVGRLDSQKGGDWLLQQAENLLQQLPEHHLVFVGEGKERERLEGLRAKLKCAPRVHFVGWQPDPRVWMQRSELLLLPTRWEGMPNVLLEAMAEGLAVVASDAHGIREVLGDDPFEQSIPLQEQERWVGQVVRLARDGELRKRIGAANQKKMGEQYSLDVQLARYEELYKSLLS